jgi:hypothetical protein
MKFLPFTLAAICAAQLSAAEMPAVFSGLFQKDVPVRGQIGVVVPPPEIEQYVAKVEQAAKKNPEWFREFSKTAKPGAPLPFDEKLGLTKEEYDAYLKLWAKREFKPMQDAVLVLRETSDGSWTLAGTGNAATLSTLRYQPKSDSFRSPNGELKRIEDINADAASILGAWTGREWRFEEESSLGKTKENIAIGQHADKKYGLVVYRAQEISSEGTRLLDKSLVIRFPLGKAAAPATPAKPAAEKPAPAKAAEKKSNKKS